MMNTPSVLCCFAIKKLPSFHFLVCGITFLTLHTHGFLLRASSRQNTVIISLLYKFARYDNIQELLFKNRKDVQLNKFIKGDVSPFTVNDLKIFKLIISKVDSKDSLFQDFYEITTDEIRHLNINEKHLYSETKKSLKRLANIYITFEENDSFREVGLIRNDFRFDKY